MTTFNCNITDLNNFIIILDNKIPTSSNFKLLRYTIEKIKVLSKPTNIYISILNVDYHKIDNIIDSLEKYYEESYKILMDLDIVLEYSIFILLPEVYQSSSDLQLSISQRSHDELVDQRILMSFLIRIVQKIKDNKGLFKTRLLLPPQEYITLPIIYEQLIHTFGNDSFIDYIDFKLPITVQTKAIYRLPNIKLLNRYSHVYVGGFFDYFHLGHREYLSIGSLLSSEKFFVSVLQKPSISNNSFISNSSLGDIMNSQIDNSPVKSKDDFSQSIETRLQQIKEFFQLFNPNHPSIEIISNNRCSNINLCPMTFLDIHSIAVIAPSEVYQTAEKLNQIRCQRSLKQIEIFKIKELTYHGKKISSTDIRTLLFQKRNEDYI